MSTPVRFEQVSKQYRLGTGATSLRDAFSHALGRLQRRGASGGRKDSTLWALKDVSFALQKGEALGIIGPNGAGKTTILKLLSGITQPSEGTIAVDGRISALIELGAGFHPDLTGQENLYLNAAILGLSRREVAAKFESIVEFSGLHDYMDTPVKRYSSGMYVRLGFSVAAHVEPDILLVDEVLAVGDAAFRQKCIERIQALRRNGTTIVFVSHSMNLVRSVCDRGLFLLGGQLQALGPALDAIQAYRGLLHSAQSTAVAHLNQSQQSLAIGEFPAAITSIELLNGKSHRSDHFRHTDNVQVRFAYEVRELIRSPSLLVRIIRSDGVTCCEIRTRNDQVWLPDLEGSGHICFSLEPLQLASGSYVIEIRLQDATDAVALGVGQSDWFQVGGPGATAIYDYGGIYVPQVRWGFAPETYLPQEKGFSPVSEGKVDDSFQETNLAGCD